MILLIGPDIKFKSNKRVNREKEHKDNNPFVHKNPVPLEVQVALPFTYNETGLEVDY